jgi:predicted transposase YdaD
MRRLSHDKDLLALAEMYGGLAFTSESEKAQFKRRFLMFQDIMKDSWVYQEIVQESEERGRGEGQAKGQAKGIQSHRQAIVDIVSKRFPLLNQLASQQAARMTDLDALRMLIVNISITDSEEVMYRLLIDAAKN